MSIKTSKLKGLLKSDPSSIKEDTLTLNQLGVVKDFCPFSAGFEFETRPIDEDFDNNNMYPFEKTDTYHRLDNFFSKLNLLDHRISYINDEEETTFRIPSGLDGLISLQKVLEMFKSNYYMNDKSGIHIHVDISDVHKIIIQNKKKIIKKLKQVYAFERVSRSIVYNVSIDDMQPNALLFFIIHRLRVNGVFLDEVILRELDSVGYKGDYNFRQISCNAIGNHVELGAFQEKLRRFIIHKSHFGWVRLQMGSKETMEYRIFKMSFDYGEVYDMYKICCRVTALVKTHVLNFINSTEVITDESNSVKNTRKSFGYKCQYFDLEREERRLLNIYANSKDGLDKTRLWMLINKVKNQKMMLARKF